VPGRSSRDAVVRHRLALFCEAQGLGGTPWGAEVAEAFVVGGLAGRAASTKGTYRSVLRAMAGTGRPARATPFQASPAKAPYSAIERAELLSVATAQRPAWRRGSALALLALGTGAGLRAGEVANARGEDVLAGPDGVAVRVSGARGRLVAVTGTYAQVLAERAGQVGAGHLFCPGGADRSYKNFVNNFARGLVASPGSPRLCPGRCRSSFICDHLGAGTPLGELTYLAGIVQVESLLRYAHHVPGAPRSKAELRARLAGR